MGGGPISRKKCYVTLEWPLNSSVPGVFSRTTTWKKIPVLTLEMTRNELRGKNVNTPQLMSPHVGCTEMVHHRNVVRVLRNSNLTKRGRVVRAWDTLIMLTLRRCGRS